MKTNTSAPILLLIILLLIPSFCFGQLTDEIQLNTANFQTIVTTDTPNSVIPYEVTTAVPSHAEGKTFWDGTEHALVALNDESEITHQLGQEGLVRVFNDTGVTILNGKIVYIDGSEGMEFQPTIALARADMESTAAVLGWATHDIEDSTFGYVTFWGQVHDIDTSSFSDGDTLYLDETTAGEVRLTPPPAGNFKVLVGHIIRSHATLGSVQAHLLPDLGLPAGDASELVFTVLKGSGGTINVGEVVYISGFDVPAGVSEVELANAGAAGTMPAIGIARETITDAVEGRIVVSGRFSNLDTSSFSVGDGLYVDTTSGDLTNVKPTGTALIQRMGSVSKVDATTGVIEVVGAGRTNDIPNIATGNVWMGNGSGVPVATSRSGLDDTAIHDDTSGEIDGIAEKTDPIAADLVLIEDSAAGNAKKKVQVGNLPITSPELSETGDASTTSGTYVVISGMTTTPAAGTYTAFFSTSGEVSANNADVLYAIFEAGTIVQHTEREFDQHATANEPVPWQTQAKVTVNGAQAIDVRFLTSSGTVTVHERSLILLKVSN